MMPVKLGQTLNDWLDFLLSSRQFSILFECNSSSIDDAFRPQCETSSTRSRITLADFHFLNRLGTTKVTTWLTRNFRSLNSLVNVNNVWMRISVRFIWFASYTLSSHRVRWNGPAISPQQYENRKNLEKLEKRKTKPNNKRKFHFDRLLDKLNHTQ